MITPLLSSLSLITSPLAFLIKGSRCKNAEVNIGQKISLWADIMRNNVATAELSAGLPMV
jgi:hypothetical protein